MPITSIAIIVILILIALLVLTIIPAILALKRTAETVGQLATMVQSELRPVLQELTSVLAELKTVTAGVAEHSDDVKCFMTGLGMTGTNLHTINRAVSVVSDVVNTTSAWTTGAKVAGKYLLERYLKKRGGI